MSTLLDKLEADYLLGCIKYRDAYSLYAMPLGWWILNFSKYDPAFAAYEDASAFRNGVLNVVDAAIETFLHVIETDKITPADFNLATDVPPEQRSLNFFVDFDAKLFINGYYENVEPETYLPDDHWRGELGFPTDYLPKEFASEFAGLA
ncbi:MAG TPA: hypothetical protein VGS79_27845 [Puia sp.]|nr:hypothetical protein [Puia sp.]